PCTTCPCHTQPANFYPTNFYPTNFYKSNIFLYLCLYNSSRLLTMSFDFLQRTLICLVQKEKCIFSLAPSYIPTGVHFTFTKCALHKQTLYTQQVLYTDNRYTNHAYQSYSPTRLLRKLRSRRPWRTNKYIPNQRHKIWLQLHPPTSIQTPTYPQHPARQKRALRYIHLCNYRHRHLRRISVSVHRWQEG
ncbi:hypothetical protein GQ44DRAFT_793088, partial [Phaeosphaeriaceae sp. PMI808]